MIQIGRTYNLKVVKETEFGVYLDAENLGEILLPSKHAPDHLSIAVWREIKNLPELMVRGTQFRPRILGTAQQ